MNFSRNTFSAQPHALNACHRARPASVRLRTTAPEAAAGLTLVPRPSPAFERRTSARRRPLRLGLIIPATASAARIPMPGWIAAVWSRRVYDRAAGLRVSGSAAEIAQVGKPVERESPPGDLVFFNTRNRPGPTSASTSATAVCPRAGHQRPRTRGPDDRPLLRPTLRSRAQLFRLRRLIRTSMQPIVERGRMMVMTLPGSRADRVRFQNAFHPPPFPTRIVAALLTAAKSPSLPKSSRWPFPAVVAVVVLAAAAAAIFAFYSPGGPDRKYPGAGHRNSRSDRPRGRFGKARGHPGSAFALGDDWDPEPPSYSGPDGKQLAAIGEGQPRESPAPGSAIAPADAQVTLSSIKLTRQPRRPPRLFRHTLRGI